MSHKVLFSIGSNTSGSRSRVASVISWLNKNYGPLKASEIFNTPELSGRFADYSNAIVIGQTGETADVTERRMKATEQNYGRTSQSKIKGVVEMDIDLIASGELLLRPKELDRPYFQYGWNQIGHFWPDFPTSPHDDYKS